MMSLDNDHDCLMEPWRQLYEQRGLIEPIVQALRERRLPSDDTRPRDEGSATAGANLLVQCSMGWLAGLFDKRDWVELVAIAPDGSNNLLVETHPIHEPHGRERLRAFVERHVLKSNLYYGLHPRKAGTCGRAKAEDIAAHHAICCDLDRPINVRDLDPGNTGRLRSLIRSGQAHAFCTGSGHAQIIVKLDRTGDRQSIDERLHRQQGMRAVVGSDAVFDLPRILRLPGSINHLSPKKRATGRQIELVRPLFDWE
jgi:hypothetical protein